MVTSVQDNPEKRRDAQNQRKTYENTQKRRKIQKRPKKQKNIKKNVEKQQKKEARGMPAELGASLALS